MPRSPLHRLSAALTAVWFAVAMTVGVPMQRCAMHDGLVGTLAMDAPGAASMPGMAMAGMSHGATSDAPAPPGSPHHPQHCTCVGMCACCQTPAMVVAGRVSLAARTAPPRIAHPRLAATAPAMPAPHRLPFANGPPTSPPAALA